MDPRTIGATRLAAESAIVIRRHALACQLDGLAKGVGVADTADELGRQIRHPPAPASIEEILHVRAELRHLVERMLCEYAGAVSAGVVVRVTIGSFRRLHRVGMRGRVLLELVEQAAKRVLADEIATVGAAAGARPPDGTAAGAVAKQSRRRPAAQGLRTQPSRTPASRR